MELENVLNSFLEGKEVEKRSDKKEIVDERLLMISNLKEKEDEEDEEDYEEEDEDEDEEDYEELDIEAISDEEKIKIACDILNHVQEYHPGLDKAIMILQDIVEDTY
jgi:ABC-type Zn2+ transport system substrate-binding protein/surface adhesin